jgi:AcrR family transcriptional regulator
MRTKDDQKTDLIFAGALALTARVGLVGLTVPMIAKEAGVATGTIYIYFKNKEGLVQDLFKTIKKRFASTVFADYRRDKPVKESLRKIWENILRYSVANYPEHVFVQQFNVSPYSNNQDTLSLTQSSLHPLMEAIGQGQKEDLIKRDPEQLILPLLFGFVAQLAFSVREQPDSLTQDFIDRTFQYLWDAIRK